MFTAATAADLRKDVAEVSSKSSLTRHRLWRLTDKRCQTCIIKLKC